MRVALYLASASGLLALAGCGHGLFFEERAPWRHEAEVQCLNSGAVREGAGIVRIKPIDGPGMCGADFPLKVSALGEGSPAYGYADELRPPGTIPNLSQPRWPIADPPSAPRPYPPAQSPSSPPPAPYSTPTGGPMSISPPGTEPLDYDNDVEPQPYPTPRPPPSSYPAASYPSSSPYPQSPYPASGQPPYPAAPATPLGRERDPTVTASVGPVAVKPAATLACPIVSELDRWIASAVQPAALRWFGQPVVEIKQISAYSCRGMNGQPGAHISEHAFGNALDIAAFMLADGRSITVQTGWHGLPEEQGFLRDVAAAACQQFTTVLAPGSNRFHYDHIHVDLMRRASGRRVCNPAAVDGEQIAARAAGRAYAHQGEGGVTGSLGTRGRHAKAPVPDDDDDADWVEDAPDSRAH